MIIPSASTNPLARHLTTQSPNSNSVLTSQPQVAGPQTCLPPPSSHHLPMEGTLEPPKENLPSLWGHIYIDSTKQIEDWGIDVCRFAKYSDALTKS
jgi:hypothetical protein